MRLTVVGCAGSYPGPDSPASCYLVEATGVDESGESRTWRILLDLGNGSLGALHRYADPLAGVFATFAGVAQGDTVLDVGCGRGDVSFLVARLVGERGEVLGVDRDPRALDMANERHWVPGYKLVAVTGDSQSKGDVAINEAERLHPLVNFDGIRCIMYEPDGGNVDPSGVTNAYAIGARQRGAEIHRFTPVTGTEQQADGTWIVRTEKGDIRTPWVINAAVLGWFCARARLQAGTIRASMVTHGQPRKAM